MLSENSFRVLGAIPNMVFCPKIARKLQKNYRKLEDVLTCGDVIKKCVQGPGWTFKYGNISKNSHRIAEKLGKLGGWGSLLVVVLGNIVRV